MNGSIKVSLNAPVRRSAHGCKLKLLLGETRCSAFQMRMLHAHAEEAWYLVSDGMEDESFLDVCCAVDTDDISCSRPACIPVLSSSYKNPQKKSALEAVPKIIQLDVFSCQPYMPYALSLRKTAPLHPHFPCFRHQLTTAVSQFSILPHQ